MNVRLIGLLVAIPLWAGDPAHDLRNLSLEELLHLEVTSVRKKDERLDRTAAAVYVITRDQIRRSGITSIPELLRLAPGVHVARVSGDTWAISVRGFNGALSDKLLVMIDGRTVYNPLFSGVFWGAQDTLIDDIDRIEVVRGPVSPLWGSNAVNGAINIITRPAEQTQGTLVDLGTGSEDRGHESVRYGGSKGPNTFYRVYGQSNARPQWSPSGTQLASSTWGSVQAGGRLEHHFAESELTIQGDAYSMLGDYFNSTVISQPPFLDVASTRLNSSGGNILARWTQRSASGAETVIQTYFDQVVRGNPRDLGISIKTADLDIQHWFPTKGKQQFAAGAGYRQMWDRAQNTDHALLTPEGRTYGTAYLSLADQIELKPDRLNLTLAARAERSSLNGFNLQPTVRLWWSPAKHHSAWVAWSRAVRTPSRGELNFQSDWTVVALEPMPTVLTIAGNRSFRPETSVAVDAGYRVEFKRLSFDLSAFRYAYNNLRSLELGTPQMQSGLPFLVLPGTLGNGNVGTSSGAELATVLELPGGSRLSASYSGLFSDVHHRPVGPRPPAPALRENLTPEFTVTESYSPRNQWQADWQTGLPRKMRLNLWVAHVGPVNSSAQPAQQEVPAYTRVDMQISRSIWEAGELQLGAQNLQSAHHLEFIPETQTVPSKIPRSFYVRLTWRF